MQSEYDKLVDYFKEHNKIKVIEAHGAKVHSVGWNADGKRLASGSFDKKVCIFAFDESRLTRDQDLRGHTDQVDILCWHRSHPDLLASAGGDKFVRIWDARGRKCVQAVATKGGNINIVWSPDGNTIAVGNKSDVISFIDTRTYKIFNTEQFKVETNEFAWNLNNNLFFLTNGLGQIIIMTWPDLKTLATIPAHPCNSICFEFAPNNKYFAVGTSGAFVSIWDARNLVCLRVVSRLDWPVRTLSFSHDSKLIAAGSEDLSIDIACVETGKKVHEIKIETPTFSVAWHPKRHLLAYACDDKTNNSYNRVEAGTIKLFGLDSLVDI